jgi:sterol desaturase/sphingolipid hydroxylase (fatty acid hydroxylase superfamily)
MPSPEDHEAHHAKYIVNFGAGVFDRLCGTTEEAVFGKRGENEKKKQKFLS